MNKYNNLEPFQDKGKLRKLRQWINIIFILTSIVGLVWYFMASKETGLYILVVACVFKFIELVLRIAKL